MKPGDTVECIKDYSAGWHRWNARVWHVTPPVVGKRYTVRDLCRNTRHGPGILLCEIRSPTVKWRGGVFGEASFDARHFRVIRTTTTDISAIINAPVDRASEQWDNRKVLVPS